MPTCLISLGSNLGDRRQRLAEAVTRLARLPQSQLAARSQWLESRPVGGPPGQKPFLNGAVRLETQLPPADLLTCMLRLEELAGRTREQRWAARTLDLDLLLYGHVVAEDPRLQLPHPRMTYRPFVLAGAAEAAPWMLHPQCGWTIARLQHHLQTAPDVAAIAASDRERGSALASELATRFQCPLSGVEELSWAADGFPEICLLDPADVRLSQCKLVLALDEPTASRGGHDQARSDKLKSGRPYGPAADLASLGADEALIEAAAALEAVWPQLAPG